ncbi:fumarylacetoacetate hydrolase family protein, partial [Rhodococcus phenolicus]|uniref:fumarylacetoacetate hydrolase family protein n=1 Tax=Rhodococcus phenolicus TaxID=263849 RepID=UPI001B80703C
NIRSDRVKVPLTREGGGERAVDHAAESGFGAPTHLPPVFTEYVQNVTLYPGDVIFTGTPAGVGMGRDPQRFLQPGETLDTRIEGIGEIRQRFVATPELTG